MSGRTLATIVVVCCGFIRYGYGVENEHIVETQVGAIQGVRATDGEYTMFMGIPYGVVDEKNPFGLSSPHPYFEDVFQAFDDSAICPQIEEFNETIVGTLDCLHLNIYVPDTASPDNRLPVLVWIYGGNYSIGYAGRFLYGPKYLMKQDIILVTLNYRLGAYGFMCLDIPDVPGNQGVKDQQLALKWIRRNIESFGGNSEKITIAGNSSGGTCVDFHFLYSQENLFNQVIMQSGVALRPGTIAEPDREAPLKLASSLEFFTTDVKKALNYLATLDPHNVIKTSHKLNLAFKPCVELEFSNVEQFIHQHPIAVEKPNMGKMPVLIGCNSDEGLARYETMSPEKIVSQENLFEDLLMSAFVFEDQELRRMAGLVRQYYIGDEAISVDVKEGLIRFFSDLFFLYPTVKTMKKYYDEANAMYSYIFSYDGERNFEKSILNINAPGVSHADEISYLFDFSNLFFNNKDPSPEDQLIIDTLTTLWANFVKFGSPLPSNEISPFAWPPVNSTVQYFMNIDSELKLEKRFFNDRMAFWELFYTLNEFAEKGHEINRGSEEINIMGKK